MIINRYKKMISEMNSNNSSHAFLQKGEGINASKSDVNAISYRKQTKKNS